MTASDRSVARPSVAYFCMEYGLHTDLKLYAGGLGILAGDYLKGAHDQERPIIGLGIKWKQGYTDQYIGDDGHPTTATGHSLRPRRHRRHRAGHHPRPRGQVKVWKTEAYGNSPLYLLDTDMTANNADDRWICGQLYGWFKEERLAQEIVLGVGGVRALRALGIDVDVYHFNEGHAVLAALELIEERRVAGRSTSRRRGRRRVTQVVFTTHTPVVQGNESHELRTMEFMGAFLRPHPRADGADRWRPVQHDRRGPAVARRANAVAVLHAETANDMWKHVDGRCEIVAITNCIHTPTWVDARITAAFDAGRRRSGRSTTRSSPS